jgi:TonB family protein
MSREKSQNDGPRKYGRRQIFVPKGFPDGWDQTTNTPAKRPLRNRMAGPVGAVALHGVLLALFFHLNAMREVFGQRAAVEMDWTWLPEVTLVTVLPEEPPPPEPPPKAPSTLQSVPDPPPEPALSPPPIESVPEEIPVVQKEEPLTEPESVQQPQVEPIPQLPQPETDIASANLTNEWMQVRSEILNSLCYPSYARRNRLEGVVAVILELDGSGEIASVNIRPPTPSKLLCEATLAAVRRASPFPEAGEAIRHGQIPSAAEIAVRFQLGNAGF